MSELVNARKNAANFRWQLLSTVSTLALLASVYAAVDVAKAADANSDRPTLWVELGGQLSRLDDGQEAFSPPFMVDRPSMFSPSQEFEKPPLNSIDEYGKVSFQPDGSGWVVSASVLYGRSADNKHVRQQTNPKTLFLTVGIYVNPFVPKAARFADTSARNDESHIILDFEAGKDVGLGMFGGKDGSSILNLGVRFAQFSSQSTITLKSDPDWHFSTKYFAGYHIPLYQVYHNNAANMVAKRSFHGIGPSLSWDASAPFAGDAKDGEFSFDWGLKAAVLFGRQRANVDHHATGQYHSAKDGTGIRQVDYQPPPVDLTRVRTVMVPDIGAFAGASWHLQNFKMSFGYRADFFFGAMDGGIDTAKRENVGFYGPFASVGIGIGG